MTTITIPFRLTWRESEYTGIIREFRPQEIQRSEQAGLCGTCATIWWAGFVSPSATSHFKRPAINDTTHDLEKSTCRICRFLGTVISSYDSDVFPSTPPYRLDIAKKISFGNRDIGVMRIKEAKMLPISPLSRGTHMLAIQDKCPSIFQPLDSVMIGGIPLELLKNAIDTCETTHDHHCATRDPDHLRNLKVIDCKRGRVVPAPAGCRYVALSYVWGSGKPGMNIETTFKANQLPKTVRDSCFVTQSLGYRYLWVDRYCIDQAKHEEKANQVSQMADIYASAHLTIIAAAGEDAEYGLPGVQTRLDGQSSPVLIGSIQLLRYPDPFRFDKLLEARWSSRAWTFQECYFARRRLFFTNGQVVSYICNSSSKRFWPPGWIPFKESDDPRTNDGLSRAKNIIGAYTGRQLTYESDAVAAIVGALNTIDGGTIHHIWGLPFRCYSQLKGSEGAVPGVKLPLLWQHKQPCVRRAGFPSWSPVAWTGSVQWPYPDVTSPCGKYIEINPKTTPSTAWTEVDVSGDIESAPRQLEITSNMAQLRVVRTSLHAGDETASPDKVPQGTFLAFPLLENLEFILHKPSWDIDPSSLDPTHPILGILFGSAKLHTPLEGPVILLVQDRGPHYERIGILRLDPMLNYCHELALHEFKYLRFFQRDTGKFWHHDLGDLEHMNDLDVKDTRLSIWQQSTWESFFTRNTIVLG